MQINRYKPGQSVRFTCEATVLGALTNPAALALILQQSRQAGTGTITAPSPTLDSLGFFHADVTLPFGSPAGPWVARWRATGPNPADNALVETPFFIELLDF